MEKIGAIVEGHTEEHFVRATYAAVHVTRAIPNGKTVAIDMIVEAIVDALEVMGGNISKVVILLDRENRGISSRELSAKIKEAVLEKCHGRVLYIGIPDRQIENWIVADESEMQARFDSGFKYPGDGSYGKHILNRLGKEASRGPRDTALLLKACSASRAAANSPSLQDLLSSIDFDWPWAVSE